MSLAMSCGASADVQMTSRNDPVGTWLTQDRHGVIRIELCPQGICGVIVGIARAQDEPMPTDSTRRPQCGLVIFRGSGFGQSGTAEGHITDPRNGKTYQAQLWLDEANRLHLRG